ncbi:MAG TPA: SMP-30/gluconolactonase/LRE family protein [Candidatus Polarisedimenticolaceae bacterium]
MKKALIPFALLALGALAYSDSPRDPLKLYPGNYRVLVENERVRVLDFTLAKGAKEEAHDHPANVAVFLADFRIRFTFPDGNTGMRVGHPGTVGYSDAVRHASENVGDTDAHGILVELKEPPPPPPGALTAVTLIHGLPGRGADLERHLLSLEGPTRAEPGCLRYDLYRSPDAPHEFMRYEVWSSAEALEAHKRSPHLKASFEKRQREGWTTQILTWDRVTAPATVERLDPRLDALIPVDTVVEKVVDGHDWTEGPLWDPASRSLLFSDVPRNAIFRWDGGGAARPVLEKSGYTGASPFPGREPGSNGLTFDRRGRLVMCQHGDRRIVRREEDGRLTVLADRFEGHRLNSPNDLVYRSNGDVFFTDPPFGLPKSFDDPGKEVPFQGVYRLTPDGKLTAVVRDLRAPNGIAFSPDEKILYVSNADNTNPVWMAYPVLADGSLGSGRVFADARAYVKDGEGVPDGLEVDAAGNVFGAAPGGVHVFAPDGTRLGRIVTGVKTGNVAWGGGGDLFVAANHAILRVRTLTRGPDPR